VFLDLHGAMVVEGGTDDGEGTCSSVSAPSRRNPIAVSLDLHANLSERMVRNCTVIAGYKTYPHVDQYEAGQLAGSILLRHLKARSSRSWHGATGRCSPTRCARTPRKARCAISSTLPAPRSAAGLLAATALAGFQHADIHDAGISAVVVADGDRAAAQAACDAILDTAWRRKEDFIYRGRPLDEALIEAGASATRAAGRCCCSTMPTIAPRRNAGHHARPGGGPSRGPHRHRHGPAARSRGGCAHGGSRHRQPRDVAGRRQGGHARDRPQGRAHAVDRSRAQHHRWRIHHSGPQFTGMRCYMGRTAVLDTGRAQIVVTERNQEPWDRGVFESVGIRPSGSATCC
jgi:microcystin degradation protein MlrC